MNEKLKAYEGKMTKTMGIWMESSEQSVQDVPIQMF